MSFKSIAEFLALTGQDAPTTAERNLIEATQAGFACYLCDPDKPSRPTESNDDIHIRASLLRLLVTGGTPDCALYERGVTLVGGWIDGLLDLSFCSAKGQTELDYCHFTDKPRFEQARFQILSLDDSALPGLFAQGVNILGSLYLRRVVAKGTVSLSGARIGGQMLCGAASLDGSGEHALSAYGIEVSHDIFLEEIIAKGLVGLSGAQIVGSLDCSRANFDGDGGKAIDAHKTRIGANLFLKAANVLGTTVVSGSEIGGQFSCIGADLNGNGGDAINAQGVETGESLLLENVVAIGSIILDGARISGQLVLQGASIDGNGGDALSASFLHVSRDLFIQGLKKIGGQIDLREAYVTNLADDLGNLKEGAMLPILDGFTYERISGPTTLEARSHWLKAGSHWLGEFHPQPYTQFAKVLRQMGHSAEARKVLMERTGLQAKATRAIRKVVPNGDVTDGFRSLWVDVLNLGHSFIDWIAFRVAGYGHAPVRSLWCLLGLFLAATTLAHLAWDEGSFAPNSDVILASAGWAEVTALDCHPTKTEGCDPNPALTWSNTFTASAETPTQGADWDSFSSFGYAADLVVPFLDLGQTQAWAPSKDRGFWGWWLWWMRWVLAALGWIVTGLGVAAVTGVMQRNQPE
ncbi:MAG: hypothetical protein ACK47C_13625 [Paracoccaceae bacterium]